MLLCRTALVTLLPLLAGCGSGTKSGQGLDLGGADANQIGVLIDDMNEARGSAKKLAGLFASGATVPEAKKLNQYEYSLAGKPSVSGGTATCGVRLDGVKEGGKSEKEWEFIKEGDKWKIKSAPLP